MFRIVKSLIWKIKLAILFIGSSVLFLTTCTQKNCLPQILCGQIPVILWGGSSVGSFRILWDTCSKDTFLLNPNLQGEVQKLMIFNSLSKQFWWFIRSEVSQFIFAKLRPWAGLLGLFLFILTFAISPLISVMFLYNWCLLKYTSGFAILSCTHFELPWQ